MPDMLETLEEFGRRQARPFLGICVGMQLLAERGLEHGVTAGLGWLPGQIAPMDPRGLSGEALPLPQMGWNRLLTVHHHPLTSGLPPNPHGYFVHSFSWVDGKPGDLIATTQYGGPVAAVIGRGNIVGTQFHVEKSGLAGLVMLRNFLTWAP